MTTLEIVKQYRLLYRNDAGSATYECVDADGTELLMLCPDKPPFRSMVVGFCLDCLRVRAEGAEHCDRADCPRNASVEQAPVHDSLPQLQAVEESASEPVKVTELDMEEPAAAPVTAPHVSELVERSAKQIAAKVWSEGECSRAVFNADSADKWLAHAVAIGWVIVDDNDQVKRGSVNPVPAEPVLSYREARTRWGALTGSGDVNLSQAFPMFLSLPDSEPVSAPEVPVTATKYAAASDLPEVREPAVSSVRPEGPVRCNPRETVHLNSL